MLGIIIGILLLICVLIFMKRYVSGNVRHDKDVNRRTIEITQRTRVLEANYCSMVYKVRFKLGSLYTVSTFTVI